MIYRIHRSGKHRVGNRMKLQSTVFLIIAILAIAHLVYQQMHSMREQYALFLPADITYFTHKNIPLVKALPYYITATIKCKADFQKVRQYDRCISGHAVIKA